MSSKPSPASGSLMAFKLLNGRTNKFSSILSLSIILVVAGLSYTWFENNKIHTLILAAGGRDGESYVLAEALATVVERHYPSVHLVVRETGGTAENVAMLSAGRAQLATAQADVWAGPMANLVAVLYRDDLQVFVRNDANISDFRSLRGKRIGLTRRGGQFQSFLAVAKPLGLTYADFQFVGDDDADADRALLERRADAVFRVRALGNPALAKLVQTGVGHFIPVEQAAAMKTNNPAFEASVIPWGLYAGTPPQPPADTPTVGVRRTLLARSDTLQSDIYAVASVLFSDRQEIAEQISLENASVRFLLGEVKEGSVLGWLAPRIHPGAMSFLDRDKPSFVLEHASFLGLLVTLCVLAFSLVNELRRRMARRRKTEGERLSGEVIKLLLIGQRSNSLFTIKAIRSQLSVLLTEAVQSLDRDQISNESFQNLRGIWQISVEMLRERTATLQDDEAEHAPSQPQEECAPETPA
jgi:TRAP transporter TAXI family solute receptor